ncbi:hypothetical protein Pst134EB_024896 [Puccinia striiformis f. sp. tritici]|nr:hypothetical protein Pst134EB_024896 [Puccinia striiformis f. sp. tritici]
MIAQLGVLCIPIIVSIGKRSNVNVPYKKIPLGPGTDKHVTNSNEQTYRAVLVSPHKLAAANASAQVQDHESTTQVFLLPERRPEVLHAFAESCPVSLS